VQLYYDVKEYQQFWHTRTEHLQVANAILSKLRHEAGIIYEVTWTLTLIRTSELGPEVGLRRSVRTFLGVLAHDPCPLRSNVGRF